MNPVVAIHGVGCPVPGTIITPLSEKSRLEEGQLGYQEEMVVVSGQAYSILKAEKESTPAFIEINWSDVQRPLANLLGVVRHLGFLLIAMLYIGTYWKQAWRKRQPSRSPAALYRGFLEIYLIWTALLPAYSMLLACLTGADRIAAIFLFVAGAAGLSYIFHEASKLWLSGLVWGVAFAIVGVCAEFGPPGTTHQLTFFLGRAYSIGQIVSGILLLGAAIETLFFPPNLHETWTTRLSRLGFLYIPIIGIACAGPLLMTFAMRFPKYQLVLAWGEVFKGGLGYDLAASEAIMTVCLVLIGTFALMGVVGYFLVGKNTQGCFARTWLRSSLVVAPLLLVVNGLLFVAHNDFSLFQIETQDVFNVYRYSALRILPFLPFIVGPLALLLDILGDVMFYVLPAGHPLSSQSKTQKRLKEIIDIVLARGDVNGLVVLAHSQGSVIAADVLGEYYSSYEIDLITAGSPIDSLYHSFLGIPVGPRLRSQTRVRWINLYRSGDYIGGEIKGVKNEPIGPGGHTGYWTNNDVQQKMAAAMVAKHTHGGLCPDEPSSHNTPPSPGARGRTGTEASQ